MSTEVKIVIVVVVLIGIIGLAAAASIFVFLPAAISRVSIPGPVTVTGLYLFVVYPNYTATTGYFGSSYRFLNTGPIFLQHGQTYQTTFTLLQSGGTTHYVDRIDLAFSGGFTLQSTTPTPPFPVASGTSQTITVTMTAPSTDYDGSVTINLFTH